MKSLNNLTAKAKISILVGSTLVAGLSSVVLFNGLARGEWDLPGMNQQVQHLTEQGDNHEARIQNLEAQQNTPAGEPTPTPVFVPTVKTQAVAPTPAPQVAGAQTVAPEATPAETSTPVIASYYNLKTTTDCSTGIKTVEYVTHYSDGSQSIGSTVPAGVRMANSNTANVCAK